MVEGQGPYYITASFLKATADAVNEWNRRVAMQNLDKYNQGKINYARDKYLASQDGVKIHVPGYAEWLKEQ